MTTQDGYLIIASLIPALFGAWVGFRVAPRLAQTTGRALLARCRHLALIALLPLALMAVSVALENRPDWQWRLPYVVHAYMDDLCRWMILGCVNYLLGLIAGVYWRKRHPQRGAVLGLAAVLMGGLIWVARPTPSAPLALGAPRLAPQGEVLQSTPYTCVPAAMANLLAYFGVKRTEAELALALGTSKEGTSAGRAALEFQRLGLRVTKRTVPGSDLAALTAPAMLLVDYDSHVVAFFGLTNQLARIVDPMRGSALVPRQRLEQRWTGRALEIRRAAP